MAKPRVKAPKSAKAGDVVQIKTLIRHKMETGLRKNKKTGKKIPRKIVNKFTATMNGKSVVMVDLNPSVSANPYLAFYLKVPAGGGKLDLTWTEDGGKTWKASKSISA